MRTLTISDPAFLRPVAATPFNPLTDVAWAHAYWAEGPEFVALGLADGGQVASWPSETSTNDAANGTSAQRPLYRASVAALNNKPAVDFDGTDDLLVNASVSISRPYALVAVVSHDDNGTDSVLGYASASSGALVYNGSAWRIGDASHNVVSGTTGQTGLIIAQAATTLAASTVSFNGGASGTVTGTTASPAISELRLGSRATSLPFDGKAAFLGVYSGTLSAGDITNIKAWAASHFNLTIA